MTDAAAPVVTPNFEKYDAMVEAQRENFPPLEVAPEIAELMQVNTLQLLIKLARYKFAARMLKPSDRVLEVGSGVGVGAAFLAQHCAHVTGLEIKPHDHADAIRMNRRNNVDLRLENLFDHAPSAAYDAVVCLDVLEHMPEPEGEAFLRAIARLMADDAVAIIGSPSIYSYPHQGPYSRAAHVKCYDQGEKISLVERVFARALPFSMNDEMVHTGHPKMAWYNFAVAFGPKRS